MPDLTIPDITAITSPDGMQIACRYLTGTGNPIVALHGFTGDSTTMAPLVESVRAGRPAILVDLIGHGQSSAPESPEHYAMASVVDQVLSLVGSYGPGTVHLLGYSMGGRVALSMAARAPWYFNSVTTLSSSPGIENPEQRAERYDADHALAGRIEEIGVDTFISEWLNLPLFGSYCESLDDAGLAATREQRSRTTATGLANSLRGTGTGSMPPLATALRSIRSPLLAVAGDGDDKYVELAKMMAENTPNGQFAIIANAGHVVHVENLSEVSAVVARFLSECDADEDYER